MKTEEDEEFERIEAESGWRKRQMVLDQKAENARELELDYEPLGYWNAVEGWVKLDPPAAQRKWVGLTDEEIEEGHKDSWVTKQAFESAVWWAEEKLKDKNT